MTGEVRTNIIKFGTGTFTATLNWQLHIANSIFDEKIIHNDGVSVTNGGGDYPRFELRGGGTTEIDGGNYSSSPFVFEDAPDNAIYELRTRALTVGLLASVSPLAQTVTVSPLSTVTLVIVHSPLGAGITSL